MNARENWFGVVGGNYCVFTRIGAVFSDFIIIWSIDYFNRSLSGTSLIPSLIFLREYARRLNLIFRRDAVCRRYIHKKRKKKDFLLLCKLLFQTSSPLQYCSLSRR